MPLLPRSSGTGSRLVELQRAPDQPEVAVRLRMVAQPTLGQRLVLLRQQPGGSGALEHLPEELLGVGPATGPQVRLDQPRRTQVEAALGTGQAVVPAVPVD